MISSADRNALFEAGRLRWLLHSSQMEGYDQFRSFQAHALATRKRNEFLPGAFPRVFVLDCSRRWGKDFLTLLIAVEECLRKPKGLFTYATALAKDITEIVTPLAESIFDNASQKHRPQLKVAFQGASNQFVFHNGSILRLVGLDRNPDSLRGRFSDGMFISEAGFVDSLEKTVATVIMPQFQGRLGASVLMNSTPPEVPGHAYDTLFVPDAEMHGRLVRRTIDDNPLLSSSEREEFIRAAGGRESERCRREYFCHRVRSSERVVIPEFNKSRHVVASPAPEYARGFTVIDPGVTDLCAIVVAYYDFDRAKLVIRRDWAKANAPTNEVVAAIRGLESEVFTSLPYWEGTQFRPNPAQRYSDTDKRLIIDLCSIHDLKIGPADKQGAEAALHALRNAFLQDQIEVHPDAVQTIAHLENAVWNSSRTSYERSALYGHFDLLDACKYLNRHVNRTANPNPPQGITMAKKHSIQDLHFRPDQMRTVSGAVAVAKQLMPHRWRVNRLAPRTR